MNGPIRAKIDSVHAATPNAVSDAAFVLRWFCGKFDWVAVDSIEAISTRPSCPALCAIAHWRGASDTPRLLGSTTDVSGILDRPVGAGR